MHDWLRTLWLMLDRHCGGFASSSFEGWIDRDTLTILKESWLRETSPLKYVVCPDCLDHDEEPILCEYPGVAPKWFIPCPESGRVQLRPDELQQWQFDLEAIARTIAGTLSLSGPLSVEIPQKLWRLGRAPWQNRTREVWLLRNSTSLSRTDLKLALKSSRQAIVLTYGRVPPDPLWKTRSPAFVLLSHVSQWCDGKFSIDAMQLLEAVRDQDDVVCESVPAETGRVSSRRIRRQVKEEIASMLTDEAMVAAYFQHGSVRLAAEALSIQTKSEISKDKVYRALKRSGVEIKAPTNHNSCSVRRTVASQRCDNRKIISNSTDAVDWQ